MSTISFLDYGLGNTGFVCRMIEKVGGHSTNASSQAQLDDVSPRGGSFNGVRSAGLAIIKKFV